MAAALSACEAGCTSILLADRGVVLGGVLPQCIHHGFGLSRFNREITGPEYAEILADKIKRTPIEIALNTTVVSVSADKTAVLSGTGGVRRVAFESMILASGCRETAIGALNIAGTRPAGIFTAGQAQELINLRRQDVGREAVIIGSGDLGMIIARRLVLEGKRVAAVVESKPQYGGIARNYHRCIESHGITLICSATVTEVFGEERVCGVTICHLDSGEKEYIPCDTLITAAGMKPERALIDGIGSPAWLSLCGNCSRIHDIVDSAVDEAEKLGTVVGGRNI